eukprot:1191309-Prorocentrum_minimum.AAC.2
MHSTPQILRVRYSTHLHDGGGVRRPLRARVLPLAPVLLGECVFHVAPPPALLARAVGQPHARGALGDGQRKPQAGHGAFGAAHAVLPSILPVLLVQPLPEHL